MNNGDMPAMPMNSVSAERAEGGFFDPFAYGLSKREHFAAMAMQGFLSNRLEVPSTEGKKLVDFIAKCSVDYANALLKALENDDETDR